MLVIFGNSPQDMKLEVVISIAVGFVLFWSVICLGYSWADGATCCSVKVRLYAFRLYRFDVPSHDALRPCVYTNRHLVLAKLKQTFTGGAFTLRPKPNENRWRHFPTINHLGLWLEHNRSQANAFTLNYFDLPIYPNNRVPTRSSLFRP